jgi:hypothetical protein
VPTDPDPTHDELYEEVKRYRDSFKDCSAMEILQLMGEMHEFFFGRMTPEDYARFERIRSQSVPE